MVESFGSWIIENKEWLFSGLAISLITVAMKVFSNIAPAAKLRFKGEWDIFVNDNNYGNMSIRQMFFIVWAYSEIKTGSNSNQVLRYKFFYYGMIYGDQAVMRYREQGQERRIVGSTVLRMMRNQREIRGGNIFWHHDNSRIEDVKFTLQRQP